MSYQKLQQAAELYVKLQQLDEQIAGLEKVAMLAADGESEVSLNLSILPTAEMRNPDPEETDEYFQGRIPTALMNHFANYGMSVPKYGQVKTKAPVSFFQSLSDVVTLQILGMLMYEKKMLRKEIVEKIKELNLV